MSGTSGQRKAHSWAEAVMNTAVGALINGTANAIFLPMFFGPMPLSTNLWITAIFTVISVARSYCMRRFFNWLHVKQETAR